MWWVCKSAKVTDAELAYSRQSCASYREGPCHNIAYMLYVHKWSARSLGAGNVFYGPRLGVDNGLQMVEIERKKKISSLTEREKQFSVAVDSCALIMLSCFSSGDSNKESLSLIN